MAQATDERVEAFRRLSLARLVARFRPERVVIFGSRARGDALRESDLDVLVVSDAFSGVPWLERAILVDEEVGLPGGVELLCYSPEEYARKVEELGIVRTAVLEGFDLLSEAPPGGVRRSQPCHPPGVIRP